MDRKHLFSEAYRMLNRSTPLRLDCGTLCEKACCKGNGEDSGMYLFPGEEVMFEPIWSFLTIKSTDLKIQDGSSILIAECNGTCDRDLRPLSCRIFPLTPYITENDILTVKMDPRAERLCPLARYSTRKDLNRDFVKNVRSVFQNLIKDEEIKSFVLWLSHALDDYAQLPWFNRRNS